MAAAVNPLTLGIGAGASFAGGILSAIGSGPSRQMQALNQQVQSFSGFMTDQAKKEGLAASSVFQNLMTPLQRIVQGGPQQAGWSNAQVASYNAGVTNRSAAAARDLGGLGTVTGGPGSSQAAVLAARQKAEDERAAGIASGEQKNFDTGREEFNTAVGEEQKLPSVYSTANQGASAAGAEQQEAEKSQQNIDTEKKAASFTGVLSKGLSGVGGAMLGGSAAGKLAGQQMVPGMQGKSAADKGLEDNEDTADTGITPPTTPNP
jgi:hypothetical protein